VEPGAVALVAVAKAKVSHPKLRMAAELPPDLRLTDRVPRLPSQMG